MAEQSTFDWRKELRFLIPVLLIAFLMFATSLTGEFVYDDTRQIVRNLLIQDPSLYGKALTSDVWAFKGDGSVVMSNYWRPTFTAFHILSYQLFGLSPFGWHLLNVLVYSGICGLVFLLLRRLGATSSLSFAISIIFAVHPVHTESAAWISGSPDLLFALCLLCSLWFAQNYSERFKGFDLVVSIALYVLALGAKEAAILCFPMFWLIFSRSSCSAARNNGAIAIRSSLPFVLAAVLYFFLRWAVLGQISHPVEDATGLREGLMTVPSAFVFYLKQIVFPFAVGPNYPPRPVAGFDALNFFLPLLISAAACALLYKLARRSLIQKAGLLLFLLPLAPALNIAAFMPEQIVHDRYLFLPLLGFLMLILPFGRDLALKFVPRRSEIVLTAAAVLVCIPLALKTYFYNQVWKSEAALWEHSVKIDVNSSFNWSQYGTALAESGDFQRALKAYDKALEIKPMPLVYLGRARTNLNLQNFEEAVRDLKTITELPPANIKVYTLYLAYEALAIAFIEQKKPNDALNVLLEARSRLPIYSSALTGNVAVVYY